MDKKRLIDNLKQDQTAENWHKISQEFGEKDMLELTMEFEEQQKALEMDAYVNCIVVMGISK